jgi:hypothetical protein
MTATINASTSSGLVSTADTSGTLALQSNGTTQFTVASTGAYGTLKSATAQASTSGTSIDFTSIPSWVKRVTVMFQGVSTNGTSNHLVQIGSSTFTTSGYLGTCSNVASASANSSQMSTGFLVNNGAAAAAIYHGFIVITLINSSTNAWVESGSLGRSDGTAGYFSAGSLALSGTLDRVRITTVNGTDTFDAGTINIIYEG